ncbi:MAG: hypothetical protein JO128_23300 [Alphaproteobacteria bacterium]|nr:hypothetical protein [Alphaproteobacteria bacterium]
MGRDIDTTLTLTDLEDIARAAMQGVGGGPPRFVGSVVSNFIELKGCSTPPATWEAGARHNPDRILLSWRRLMPVLPEIVLDSAEANSAHVWLIVFMALAIWSRLAAPAPERVGVDDATTMLALWRYRNDSDEISDTDGFARTNAVRAEIRLPALARPDYAGVVDRLARLGCLSLATGTIQLRVSTALAGG